MSSFKLSRREFLAATTTTAIVASTRVNAAEVVPGKKSPNDTLLCAGIGVGGQGWTDVMNLSREKVIALCDVDEERASRAFKRFKDVPKFKDYRVMLDKVPEIEALTITTPDHSHAPAAYHAMKMGKHVYVQKPMAHTVAEARLLTQTAREMGVVTQMGNQGHSGDGVRELCEMIWSGAIGPVREAHSWTNRPTWPGQGISEVMSAEDVPATLDWNLWQGPASERPYNSAYLPHSWRAWQPYGSGALGDMACHILDPPYMALKLNDAAWLKVEVIDQKGRNKQTWPTSSTIKFSFPARGDMPPVDVYWYDGHWEESGEKVYNRPPRPEGIPEDTMLGDGDENGTFFIGDDGVITVGTYGAKPRLLPDERMAAYTMPEPWLERIDSQNHYKNFLNACKGEVEACSNFDYAGPFTEMVQFGNLAVVSGESYEWDNVKGIVKDVPNPKEVVTKSYREGWGLPV